MQKLYHHSLKNINITLYKPSQVVLKARDTIYLKSMDFFKQIEGTEKCIGFWLKGFLKTRFFFNLTQ